MPTDDQPRLTVVPLKLADANQSNDAKGTPIHCPDCGSDNVECLSLKGYHQHRCFACKRVDKWIGRRA